jgi:hypothetical protein
MLSVRPYAVSLVAAALFSVNAGAVSNHPAGSIDVPSKISGASLTNLSGVADGCGGVNISGSVTATGVTNDGNGNDTFVVQLFDDFIEKGRSTFSVPVGQTQTFTFGFLFPGPVATGVPGVGVYVSEVANGTPATFIDPFVPTQITGCSIGQTRNIPTLSTWAIGATSALLLALAGWFGFSRRRN